MGTKNTVSGRRKKLLRLYLNAFCYVANEEFLTGKQEGTKLRAIWNSFGNFLQNLSVVFECHPKIVQLQLKQRLPGKNSSGDEEGFAKSYVSGSALREALIDFGLDKTIHKGVRYKVAISSRFNGDNDVSGVFVRYSARTSAMNAIYDLVSSWVMEDKGVAVRFDVNVPAHRSTSIIRAADVQPVALSAAAPKTEMFTDPRSSVSQSDLPVKREKLEELPDDSSKIASQSDAPEDAMSPGSTTYRRATPKRTVSGAAIHFETTEVREIVNAAVADKIAQIQAAKEIARADPIVARDIAIIHGCGVCHSLDWADADSDEAFAQCTICKTCFHISCVCPYHKRSTFDHINFVCSDCDRRYDNDGVWRCWGCATTLSANVEEPPQDVANAAFCDACRHWYCSTCCATEIHIPSRLPGPGGVFTECKRCGEIRVQQKDKLTLLNML
ncbi:hypothetical protein J8273_6722 [Carpediemonas membranifera]|uniref:Uncharacterized protein n=1 Tax=Carpediemonas membranifera TaxID=201153 RepID=A0A8J6B847_9EUKA|nr:hypothetical protein J8273_6722 [Carpediemonas membranifera]|eukprot:KAG9391992.1 hypothetical protein J8273_6722 [Carpediemonas membranifera]